MASRATANVAGAGVLGLCCAVALARDGWAVVVSDPGEPFANASGVAAGMIAPVFEAALDEASRGHFDLLLAARNEWPALEAAAGVALDRSGTLAAGRAEWIAGLADAVTRLGLHPMEIGRSAAQGLAPGLTDGATTALLNREDWRVEPTAAIAALRQAAAEAGVVFRAEPVRTRGGFDLLVIATGAALDLAELAPELALLSPIKGQLVRTERTGLAQVAVRGEGVYAAPTRSGLVLGATMEPGLTDLAPDPAAAAGFLEGARRLFPALAQTEGRLVAGIRAATPDGLPLVGPSVTPGVLLAVGARRNGWLLGPMVGRLVADVAAARDGGRYATRLDPRRFTA